MKRLTKKINGVYMTESAVRLEGKCYQGDAINRLGAFEDFCDTLLAQQEDLSKKLQRYKEQNKTNSYQFKELMGQKLMNANTIMLLKRVGLLDG